MARDKRKEADWSPERVALMESLIADGKSASETAMIMGGFEHCADGGRSAIIGKMQRERQRAAKESDTEKLARLTRPKRNIGTGRPKDPPKPQRLPPPKPPKPHKPPQEHVRSLDEIPPATLKARLHTWEGGAFPEATDDVPLDVIKALSGMYA